MHLGELARQTARDIADGTAVIFLGAGVSLGTSAEQAENEGVPGSSDLMRAVAEHFGVELNEDSTLRGVTSRAARNRDPSTVKRFVVEKIAPKCGRPLKAHRALARVAPTIVMTTSYDDLYEAAMREAERRCEKVVQSAQLAGLPHNRPRVLKLHGDFERPNEIVLTGLDYRAWRGEAGGLHAEVVAALQKYTCVFVGYSVSDENMQEMLNVIRENLGTSTLKHFAVVRAVNEEVAAEWHGAVEFVEGDATEFFESLAEAYEELRPRPFEPSLARTNFEASLASGDLTRAGESCKELADYLTAQGDRTGPASLWRTFGEAAENAGEYGAAAAAFTEAGKLLLEAGHALRAEPILSAALRTAQATDEPAIEREVQPLLQRSRLLGGHYHEVLQDAESALLAYGESAPPELVYALRTVRAEAKEMVQGVDEALDEFSITLEELPEDSLYLRTRVYAAVARLLADKYEWEAAHDVLNRAEAEVLNSVTAVEETERRRCKALLKLVTANVHQALGEDGPAHGIGR